MTEAPRCSMCEGAGKLLVFFATSSAPGNPPEVEYDLTLCDKCGGTGIQEIESERIGPGVFKRRFKN